MKKIERGLREACGERETAVWSIRKGGSDAGSLPPKQGLKNSRGKDPKDFKDPKEFKDPKDFKDFKDL